MRTKFPRHGWELCPGDRPVTVAGSRVARAALGEAGPIQIDTEEMLRAVGSRIRRERHGQQLTLDTIASRTGLTSAMVSMVELGRVTPSFGSLLAIASALGIHMSDLFDLPAAAAREPVVRQQDQPIFETALGVLRRLLRVDDVHGVEFVINEYGPGTSSSATPVRHAGYEYGVLLDGALVVELAGQRHEMNPGDSISYSSSTPHRIFNPSSTGARAVWIKLDSDRLLERTRLRGGFGAAAR